MRPGRFYILGDFNIPWDKLEDSERKGLASLLSSFDLTQHVKDPTHTRGHTIDYIISKMHDDTLVKHVVEDLVSDHFLVHAFLKIAKP